MSGAGSRHRIERHEADRIFDQGPKLGSRSARHRSLRGALEAKRQLIGSRGEANRNRLQARLGHRHRAVEDLEPDPRLDAPGSRRQSARFEIDTRDVVTNDVRSECFPALAQQVAVETASEREQLLRQMLWRTTFVSQASEECRQAGSLPGVVRSQSGDPLAPPGIRVAQDRYEVVILPADVALQHPDLAAEMSRVRARARSSTNVEGWADIQFRFTSLAALLRAHEEAEDDIVYESLLDDL